MTRLIAVIAGLVVLCLLLPAIARAAQAAVPALLSVLLLLAIARLFWPSRRRR
jgi:membrane protein implicated in regulation of membrane protease activity